MPASTIFPKMAINLELFYITPTSRSPRLPGSTIPVPEEVFQASNLIIETRFKYFIINIYFSRPDHLCRGRLQAQHRQGDPPVRVQDSHPRSGSGCQWLEGNPGHAMDFDWQERSSIATDVLPGKPYDLTEISDLTGFIVRFMITQPC